MFLDLAIITFKVRLTSCVPDLSSNIFTHVEAEDSYKHGAFLEKADRFDKDKESDIPGACRYRTPSQ
jgi:hypothetical protein